jgi:3-isopropylmalate dehydrogenase
VADATIALLPGDGIGPEIIDAADSVLAAVGDTFGHTLSTSRFLIGGAAIDQTGEPCPPETLEGAAASDAIILGAVGGYKWDDPTAKTRPEAGLLRIRSELGLFANLRPVTVQPTLLDASPLRRELVADVDILFVRELTGGIYFGEVTTSADGTVVANSMQYSVGEIERIVRVAADAARRRGGKLTSVDKANVLAVSRLWRATTDRVMATEYPDVELETVLVDAMAMHLLSRPRDFDVVVTGNLFGDILTDEASMLPGSLGLLPSASLGISGPGLYEPVHGSAPDLAGRDVANPLGTILATAMALRHSLDMALEAEAVESAVSTVLDGGLRTADIARGGRAVGTKHMTRAVVAEITSR